MSAVAIAFLGWMAVFALVMLCLIITETRR